tara:strand:+ start:5308 stop:5670 length:363 start_codon:yes stop_codon:yes gene_type:complete
MQCKIILPKIVQEVHLGTTKEEQQHKQLVAIRIDILFNSPPLGCINDDIKQTMDYAQLAEDVESICQADKFHLIEHLAAQIYQGLKDKHYAKLQVSVHKEKPPHRLLDFGATCVYGDEIK